MTQTDEQRKSALIEPVDPAKKNRADEKSGNSHHCLPPVPEMTGDEIISGNNDHHPWVVIQGLGKSSRISKIEYRAFLSAMKGAILVVNAEGRYVKIAPNEGKLLDKSVCQLTGRRLHDIVEPSKADWLMGYVQLALSKGQTIDVKYSLPISHPKQVSWEIPVRWFIASIYPMNSETVIWVTREIQPPKNTPQQLLDKSQLVCAVLDMVGVFVMLLDAAGCIVRFNRYCEQITGYSFEDVKGQPISDLFAATDDLLEAHSIGIPTNGESHGENLSKHHENYWRTKDGELRLIAWSNTALQDKDGKIETIIVTGIDITERSHTEAALKQENEQLALTVEERTAALKESNDQLVEEIVGRFRAETELRCHKDNLEELVKQRTAQLEQANQQLRAEINERKRIEQELFQEKELAQVTLHSIGDAVITTDAQGCIELLNPAAGRLTGWSAQDAVGKPLSQVFHVVDEITREPVENPVEVVLRGNRLVEMAHATVLIAKDGTELAIDKSVAPIRASDGQIVGAVLVFHDVTEERALTRQLSWQASHDALTGLVNRREFEQHLKRALLVAQTQHQQHALCYLDLDRFKIVNDTCGHVAGDELLRQVSALLQAGVRKTDILARLGGDEFALLLHQCPLEQARRVANSLRESIQAFRFVWDDKTFSIGASLGLVTINSESRSLTQVLNAADAACYAAKEQGRNRVHVYEADDSERAEQHSQMQWVSRIAKAFEENRFRLYFQPIIPLLEPNTNQLHYEVLLRLNEGGQVVSPMAFIPAAERYNIMHTIDRWVIRTLFSLLSSVNGLQNGQPKTPHTLYGINLSGATLNDENFSDFLQDQLIFHKLPPDIFCFEIPETVALANLSKVGQFIRDFKSIGCKFALDDFGSGTSSFSYLKNMPVDYLKIDGGFVKNVVENPLDVAMIEAINRISHVMGLRTIAEFVENDDILVKLRSLGIDFAQGYGIAKPHPLTDFEF